MKKNSSINNEAILRHVIHNMPDYVLWKDINSVYIGCNLNAAKLFGLQSANQIIGKTDDEIFPEQAKELIKYDKIAIKTGKTYKTDFQIKKFNKNELDFLNVEIKPLKNNRQIFGILYIAKNVTNDEKNKIKLDELIKEQESSYKILEKAVKEITGQRFHKRLSIKQYVDELSNCFRNIILQMPCYVYWKDKNFKYIYCNELSAEILGLKSVEEVVGKTDYDFGWDPEIVNEYRKIDAEIVKTGQPKLGFEESLIKDNKEYHLLVNKMPLFNNNGKVIGIIGITIDITDRKDAEKLKLETQAQQLTIDSQQDIKKFIDTVQNAIQMYKINDLNHKLGIKKPILQNIPSNLKLTKREGQILFYLSLSKPPKEISRILTVLEKKPVTANTIQSIINKQLYPKFEVHNLSQLIEVALALGFI